MVDAKICCTKEIGIALAHAETSAKERKGGVCGNRESHGPAELCHKQWKDLEARKYRLIHCQTGERCLRATHWQLKELDTRQGRIRGGEYTSADTETPSGLCLLLWSAGFWTKPMFTTLRGEYLAKARKESSQE